MSEINPIVCTGNLWLGKTWKEAIVLSLATPDNGVETVWKYKNPTKLLDDEKVIIGYQIYGYGNNRRYQTRIPESMNDYVRIKIEKEPA